MYPGVYINLYEVKVNDEDLFLVKEERAKYPSLKELRDKIRECGVYPVKDKIYGYGKDLSELRKVGFIDIKAKVFDLPQLTCKMILDGFSNNLEHSGYKVECFKFRMQAFDIKNPISLSLKEITLYPGCEFGTIFLMNPVNERLIFGIILDLKFKLELNGTPASYRDVRRFISEKYDEVKAYQMIKEIRFNTGDITPYGKRSSESSRFRMEKIKEIIDRVKERFELPNGIMATLIKEQIRIVEEGTTYGF